MTNRGFGRESSTFLPRVRVARTIGPDLRIAYTPGYVQTGNSDVVPGKFPNGESIVNSNSIAITLVAV